LDKRLENLFTHQVQKSRVNRPIWNGSKVNSNISTLWGGGGLTIQSRRWCTSSKFSCRPEGLPWTVAIARKFFL